jgi:Glycoside-hydrolase family GH114
MCDAQDMRVRSPRVEGLFVGLAALVAALVLAGAAAAQRAPRLVIAPAAAPVGHTVTVRGSGFRPHLRGVVVFGGLRVASFRAGASGRFRVSFVVPAGHSRRLRVVGVQRLRNRRGSLLRLSKAAVGFQVIGLGALDKSLATTPSGAPMLGSTPAGGQPGGGGTRGGATSPGGGSGTGSTTGGGGSTGTQKSPKTEGSKGSEGSKEEPPLKEPPKEEPPKEGSGGGSRWIPPQHLTWYWQLQGSINNSQPVAAYDIDGFETSAAEVSTLHGQGKHVICYVDVGTYEPGRPDSSSFPASILGSGVQGWPGEQWLDVGNLAVLEPIMTARFQMCAAKGFDAVEPDNMDGFENGSGFPLTSTQQLTYDEWVAGEVHSLGMAVFQKNDGQQTPQLVSHFDGALDEQCNQYSECSSFQPYSSAGKPVLNAEYELSIGSFCSADTAAGIMGARFDLSLSGTTFEPCW